MLNVFIATSGRAWRGNSWWGRRTPGDVAGLLSSWVLTVTADVPNDGVSIVIRRDT